MKQSQLELVIPQKWIQHTSFLQKNMDDMDDMDDMPGTL